MNSPVYCLPCMYIQQRTSGCSVNHFTSSIYMYINICIYQCLNTYYYGYQFEMLWLFWFLIVIWCCPSTLATWIFNIIGLIWLLCPVNHTTGLPSFGYYAGDFHNLTFSHTHSIYILWHLQLCISFKNNACVIL